ncbi:MAG: ABC transporter permease [Pseudomonadota bacterium]
MVLVMLWKEIVDNLRDRQTVFYALLFGPVLLPLLIGGALVASLKQATVSFDEPSALAVSHSERAPNLMQFLHANNMNVAQAPTDVAASVRRGDVPVVLEVPEDFATALRNGTPAPLIIHVNDGDKHSAKEARKLSTLLRAYSQTINALRMQHRGIDPTVFNSISVSLQDVSSNGFRGQLLASILPFLLIVAMVMGGFYLAIDTTAGERERQSLEPLLSLPLPRYKLVLGKYLAVLTFVGLSSMLTAVSLFLVFRFLSPEAAGGILSFDAATITRAWLLASPLIFFISAVLMTVAASTKSTKEAQTYLGLLMVFPMAPFFILQFVNIKSVNLTMALPMLSQYQLLERVVLQDHISALHIILSITGTLVAAALLYLAAVKLYSREKIL